MGERAQQPSRSLLSRLSVFGLVGAGGILVQLMVLAILLRLLGLHYLLATGLAVEASVVFNFVWHRKWTWADRPRSRAHLIFVRFNLSNGVVSILINLCLMLLFVSWVGLRPLPANMLSIAICSVLNFALADRFVFV
jgi:putative flippase GtrA